MNLDHLKTTWAYVKAVQSLEPIPEEEILALIETKEIATPQSVRYGHILLNVLVFSMNLFLYQSC